MRKVLFLLLFLLVLGAANVSAQVRIGGDEAPNAAAVLDLNADETTTGTKGLALPRVSLDSNDDDLGYSGLLEGMLVYNTNAGMIDGDGVGVYYWDGNQWVKSAGIYEGSTSITLSGNSFQRAALSGDVTAAENSNTVTINDGAVSFAKTSLRSISVSLAELGIGAGSTITIPFPAGCTIARVMYTTRCNGACVSTIADGPAVWLSRVSWTGSAASDFIRFWCFD